MTERTRGRRAAVVLVVAELAALAVMSLSWWIGTYVNWDPQFVGPRVGPYVAKMGAVAAIAGVVSVAATVKRVRAVAWSQAVVMGLALALTAGMHALGTSVHEEQQRKACRAGLGASSCTHLR